MGFYAYDGPRRSPHRKSAGEPGFWRGIAGNGRFAPFFGGISAFWNQSVTAVRENPQVTHVADQNFL
jgi:hypothetical protein